MKKKYEARVGSPFKKREAQKYGERLEYLGSKNKGKLTPELVVNDARNKSSPFYDYFEWDDRKASIEHRLQQARNLINHIIEVVVIEGRPSRQRSFFSVSNGQGNKVYVNIRAAITKQSYRQQLLKQALTTSENLSELIRLFMSHEK